MGMAKTTMKLSEMRHPAKNVRKHSQSQITEYMRSVEMFGQIRPIVVDDTGEILAGNGLYDALVGLGRETADVYVMTGLTPVQKKKLMLADNRIFNLGSDDMGVFEEFVAELGGDFDVPGYPMELLKTLSFDADDVDEANASYGRISTEDKEALQRTEERYARERAEAEETAQELPSGNEHGVELQRRYIVCPKCGEKIWL